MRGKLVIAGASAIVGIGVGLVGTTEPVAAHHAFCGRIRRGTTCGIQGHGDECRVDQSSRLDPRRRDERRRHRGAVGLRSRHAERVVQTRLYAPVSSAWCGGARRRLSSKGWHQSGEWPRTSRSPMEPNCSSGRRAPAPPTSSPDPASIPQTRLADDSQLANQPVSWREPLPAEGSHRPATAHPLITNLFPAGAELKPATNIECNTLH